jgi:hypothetical protein
MAALRPAIVQIFIRGKKLFERYSYTKKGIFFFFFGCCEMRIRDVRSEKRKGEKVQNRGTCVQGKLENVDTFVHVGEWERERVRRE